MSAHKAAPAEPEIDQQQPATHMTAKQPNALREATQRAEAAEAELARLKSEQSGFNRSRSDDSVNGRHKATADGSKETSAGPDGSGGSDGITELRKDSMMAHLIDSLEAGKDIGHYGRLVFAMVARHFLPHEEVLSYLTRDKDFSEEQAILMLRQVEGRDYNPPRRERILEWQSQQDFPILPNPEDPDCGNLYRNLKFPSEIYDHIGHYQEEKLQAEDQVEE